MDNKYSITLESVSSKPGYTPDFYELTTTGVLTVAKDGSYKISYTETDADGSFFENVVTAKGDLTASVSRLGIYGTSFTLDTDKKQVCIVNTPMGELCLGVLTHTIKNDLTKNGGELFLQYTLDANNRYLCDNEVKLKVTRKEIV
jgi:uncharacterized beta-barrel protein YwiB (DUF1934 family)